MWEPGMTSLGKYGTRALPQAEATDIYIQVVHRDSSKLHYNFAQ